MKGFKNNDEYQFLSLKREIYTNKKLKVIFNKYFGYRRYIFNKAIEIHRKYMRENYGYLYRDPNGNTIHGTTIRNCIKRNSLEWEKEYSSQIIDTTVEDYYSGYEYYIKGFKKSVPKFKKKFKSIDSFRFNMKQWNTPEKWRTFYVEDNKYLTLPRIKTEVGRIKLKEPLFHNKYKYFYKLEGFQIVSVAISRQADRYYAIFIVKFKEGSLYKDLPEKNVGIDMGVKNLATLAYKNKKGIYEFKIFDSDKIRDRYRKYENKIIWYNKMLSRKEFGSKLWNKTRIKLQKVFRKIVNFTLHHHHVLTTDIINSFENICIDMFKIKPLISKINNKKFRKFLVQNNTYRFYDFIRYKSNLYGNILIDILGDDIDFNSTNRCSNCNHTLKNNKKITLKERKFKCPKCGFKFDRDANAAINLEKYISKNI